MDDAVTRELLKLRDAQVTVAKYRVTGLNPLRVQGDRQEVEILSAMDYQPVVGQWVWATRQNGIVVAFGVDGATPPSSIGTVGTVSPEQPLPVTTTDGQVWSLGYLSSYSPTSGDTVSILWQSNLNGWTGIVLGKAVNTTPPAHQNGDAPSVDGGGFSGVFQSTTVVAATAKAAYDGWFAQEEPGVGRYGSGQLESGWWFYGAGAFSQVSGGNIQRIAIRINRTGKWAISSGTLKANLVLHTDAVPGANAPSVLNTLEVSIDPGINDIELPIDWGTALAVGNGSGIGVVYSGDPNVNYMQFSGLSQDPESGLISIDWIG